MPGILGGLIGSYVAGGPTGFGWMWSHYANSPSGIQWATSNTYDTLPTDTITMGYYTYGSGASVAIVDYDVSTNDLPVITNLSSYGMSTSLNVNWPMYHRVHHGSDGFKYISYSKPGNTLNTASVMRANRSFSTISFYEQIDRTTGSEEQVGAMTTDGSDSYVAFTDPASWQQAYRIYKFNSSGTVLWTANSAFNYGSLRVQAHDDFISKLIVDASGNLHAFTTVYSNTNSTGQGFEAFGNRVLWESFQSNGTLRFSNWIKPANTSIHGNSSVWGSAYSLNVTKDSSSIYVGITGSRFASSSVFNSVVSLNPNGTMNWQRNELFGSSNTYSSFSSSTVYNNKLYVTGVDLAVFDPATGAVDMTRAVKSGGSSIGSFLRAINRNRIILGHSSSLTTAVPTDGSGSGKTWTHASTNYVYEAGGSYSNTNALEVITAANRTTPGWGGFSEPNLTTTTSNISSINDNGSRTLIP